MFSAVIAKEPYISLSPELLVIEVVDGTAISTI
jgi:hypothetical protein